MTPGCSPDGKGIRRFSGPRALMAFGGSCLLSLLLLVVLQTSESGARSLTVVDASWTAQISASLALFVALHGEVGDERRPWMLFAEAVVVRLLADVVWVGSRAFGLGLAETFARRERRRGRGQYQRRLQRGPAHIQGEGGLRSRPHTPHQCRDRRGTVHQPLHRKEPRLQYPAQARPQKQARDFLVVRSWWIVTSKEGVPAVHRYHRVRYTLPVSKDRFPLSTAGPRAPGTITDN